MAYSTGKSRTWAIWLLVIVAVIAGILALLDAARYMGWLPVATLGELKFVLPSAQWFGAILSAIVAVIWFVVAYQLYKVDPRGWLFVVVIAIINLIFLFLAVLGKSTFQSVLLGVVINAVALILALLPGTKDAFNV
jgi:hypothetical protein